MGGIYGGDAKLPATRRLYMPLWKTDVKDKRNLRTSSFFSSWLRGNMGRTRRPLPQTCAPFLRRHRLMARERGGHRAEAGRGQAGQDSTIMEVFPQPQGRGKEKPPIPACCCWVLAWLLRSQQSLQPQFLPQPTQPSQGQATICRPRWENNSFSASILSRVRRTKMQTM